MQVCKPCHYALVEAVEPFKLHPTSMAYIYEVFEHLLRLWMDIWLYIQLLPPQTLPKICEIWLISDLIQVCKPCHYKAVEPFKLHPMSMSYIYEVIQSLLRLWMGIWLHTHTITTMDVPPDFWDLAVILPDAIVQTMPLCFGWGCRTFQTTSHVHGILIYGVWAPSQVVNGYTALHSHCYLHRHFPRFVRFGWYPTLYKCANHATTRL